MLRKTVLSSKSMKRLAYARDFATPHKLCFSAVTNASSSSADRTGSPLKKMAADWSSIRMHNSSTSNNELRNSTAATVRVKLNQDTVDCPQYSDEVEKIAKTSLRRVMSLFEDFGNSDYTIGEPMTITEHSVQTAHAARDSAENEEAQLSCLLHDVGHLCGLEANKEPGMDGCGTEEHERVGAEFLGSLGFSDTVSYLALHHVNAKRYLCATNEAYMRMLTPASKTTLKHQGGPMSEEECAAVEADARWPLVLRMRSYDEAGKDPGLDAAAYVQSYENAMLDNIRSSVVDQLEKKGTHQFPLSEYAGSYVLSEEQLDSYDQNGFLIIRNAFAPENIAKLPSMALELAEMGKEDSGERLIHHERAHDGEKRVCRVENFVKPCPEWSSESYLGIIQDIVSQAYREPAALFKDKINFKGPKCAGFLAHQDATAFVTEELASHHISVLVAVDHASPHTGALEVAAGRHKEGIFENEAGVMCPEIERTMTFDSVDVSPGDIVLFDSYLPHRSGPNQSEDQWRRAAYLTFNKRSEGDLHASYYAAKAAAFASGSAGAISVNKDFGGTIVD